VKYGLTMNAEQVGEVWGCSSWTVYQMVDAGTCPVAPLHLGRLLKWPSGPVLESVGLHFDPTTGLASARVDDDKASGAGGADLRVLRSNARGAEEVVR